MKPKRTVLPTIACLMILGLATAQVNNNRSRFGEIRVITLPPGVVVDESIAPVISSGGDVAFVSSVMSGALISFSISSAKILSSVTFGEVAGAVSMVEADGRRLIALPTANDPDRGRPATVSVIDATTADRLARIAVVELPGNAHLTPTTRALFTADGRFGVVASSFNQPTLFSFDVKTGKINSSLRLPGWPTEMALSDGKNNNTDCLVGVVSVEANALSIIKLDRLGQLSAGKSFSPNAMRFDISNNPVFSADGHIVYVAVHDGEHLFSIDTQRGTVLGMIKLGSPPQRITVANDQTGSDLIGIARMGHSAGRKGGGVTILASDKGMLTVKSEFSPPDRIQFLRANNVVFNSDASVAMIGSKNGTLFAFQTKTGQIEGYLDIGNEIHGIAHSDRAGTLVSVITTSKVDEIAMIGFGKVDLGVLDARVTSRVMPETRAVPQIIKVSSDPTELRITIDGTNFGPGAKVEFVKAGDVVFRQDPVVISDKQLTVTVSTKKVEALGRFELRVVTTSRGLSNSVTIQPFILRSAVSLESAAVQTKTPPAVKTEKLLHPGPATVVNSVRTMAADGGLRVFVETNGEAKSQDFTLTDPSRIVVDILGVRNEIGNKTVSVDSKVIKQVRIGQPRAGVVRIVLDGNALLPYRLTREGNSLIIDVGDLNTKPQVQ